MPRSAEFAEQAQRLTDSLQRLCTAGSAAGDDEPAARAQWLLTAQSWERLSAVRAGALLARRSPREIDFMPTRPEAISRAVAAAPRDAAALDRIGSPAKGLPALEWLLWTRRLAADAPSCRYAQQVAAAVVAEAQALHAAYRRGAAQGRDAAETEYAMYELLNLWDAGLQKLWWEEMDRPLQKARDGRAVPWSRATSGHTVAGWRQQWQALRALAVGAGAQVAAEAGGGGTGDASDGAVRAAASGFATAAPDGAAGGAFVDGSSLRQRLLADGRAAEADRLLQRVAAVDRAMAALLAVPEPAGARPGIAAAVLALKDLQQFAETELAAALHFIVSFFDEDGD